MACTSGAITPEALSALEIPSIGAVLTADDMTAPWLFKVAPSNLQYAESLKDFLDRQPWVKTGYLIFDRNGEAGDSYVRSLTDAFMSTFNSTYELREHNRGFVGSKTTTSSPGTPLLFADVVNDVCDLKPDVLF